VNPARHRPPRRALPNDPAERLAVAIEAVGPIFGRTGPPGPPPPAATSVTVDGEIVTITWPDGSVTSYVAQTSAKPKSAKRS
jgi:hypothetical protein